ncbi:hypothetical protein ACQP1P_30360 [Dactylosporangium sp. CA-052675]|uniref:hypothetical protein n=1 Tax=Dactylosporangium sp. CA-052675 TaxID=3239927 RepID=UPI003D9356C2
MAGDENGGHGPAEGMIDDLIRDILNDAGRATHGAGSLMPQLPRGAPLLERVLLTEVMAGALADALAPALANALAPRILQLMDGGGSEPAKRTGGTGSRSKTSGK